jgi:hypothetical protein
MRLPAPVSFPFFGRDTQIPTEAILMATVGLLLRERTTRQA